MFSSNVRPRADAAQRQFGSCERSTAAPRRITCEILRVFLMSSSGLASRTRDRKSVV